MFPNIEDPGFVQKTTASADRCQVGGFYQAPQVQGSQEQGSDSKLQ